MIGKLVVLDGSDGSGKQTQTQITYERLAARGVNIRRVSFPDYNSDSSALVKMYLGGMFGDDAEAVNPYAASSFYAVDRFASYVTGWRDDYLSGQLILADRYTPSNAIHQACKLPEQEWDLFFEWLYDYEFNLLALPRPDLVVFLDLPPVISRTLIKSRARKFEGADIHEKDELYLEKCYACAKRAAQKLGWKTVECASDGIIRGENEINDEIMGLIDGI